MTDLREVLADADHDIEVELEDGDIITDIVVLMRVQWLDDTDDALIIGTSAHMGGITQYGLVCSAKLQVEDWMRQGRDEADD